MGDGFADFEGLAAVVTGGASGIGAATATLLAARGARVAVLDRAIPEGAGKPDESGSCLALTADVTDDASVRAAVEAAAEAFGGIDVLVNNAGIGAIGTVEDNDDALWRTVFDVNLFGMVRVTRAALPHLPAEIADAGAHRVLDARAFRRASDRVHLPLRARYAKGGRAADYRTPESRLEAQRGHLERTVFLRRNQEMTRYLCGH